MRAIVADEDVSGATRPPRVGAESSRRLAPLPVSLSRGAPALSSSRAGVPGNGGSRPFACPSPATLQEVPVRPRSFSLLRLEELEPRVALSNFYVAPTGNDGNVGSDAAPW